MDKEIVEIILVSLLLTLAMCSTYMIAGAVAEWFPEINTKELVIYFPAD